MEESSEDNLNYDLITNVKYATQYLKTKCYGLLEQKCNYEATITKDTFVE